MQFEIVSGTMESGDELLFIDRPAWAWEFLRRNPEYRAVRLSHLRKTHIARTSLSVIEAPDCPADQRRWGLHLIENFEHPYSKADVFWHEEADPRVIVVAAHRSSAGTDDENRIDFAMLPADITVLKLESGTEHVSLRMGAYSLQLHIAEGTVLHGPVTLSFHIDGFQKTPLTLLALRRFVAFRKLGRAPTSLFEPDRRAKRWLMEVRGLDMQRAGKSREEMAQALFGESLSSPRSDWVLSRLRRLLTAARHISEIGYFGILAGASTKIQETPLGLPREGRPYILPFPPIRPVSRLHRTPRR